MEAQVWDELDRELDELIPVIAAEEGLARGATRVSPEKEVELWGQRDPRVDRDALKAQLMQGQIPPEWYVHAPEEPGDQRLAFVKANPEWADWLAEHVTPETPLDDEMSDIVADFAEWPHRQSVLKPYEDDPKAQVAKANSVNARWQRRAGMTEPTAPAPPSPVVPGEPTDTPEPTVADPYTLATRMGGGA
jgi:hypothetical protein